MNLSTTSIVLALLLAPQVFAPQVFAQGPPPPLPPTPPAPLSQTRTSTSTSRQMEHRSIIISRDGAEGRSLGIVPPGTWWKNTDTIAKLSLTADQQKKMDDIFRQNRLQLIDVKASLEKEQINLEPLLNANPVDSIKAMAEIARIADLRAELEKANAKMLLGLRAVLTSEQWTKLQADQHMHRGPMQMNLFQGHGSTLGPLSALDPSTRNFPMPDINIAAQHFDMPALKINIPNIKLDSIRKFTVRVPGVSVTNE